VGQELGRFRLVTMGRSFHWMDRAETLRRLDAMIDPGGAVVLIHDDHPKVPDNRCVQLYRELLERYSEDDVGRRIRKSPDWLNHTAVLLDSPFGRLEEVAVIERRRIPTETLIDRALSMSSVMSETIGGRAEALIAEIEALAAQHAAGGMLTEVVTSTALIARRPDEAEQARLRRRPAAAKIAASAQLAATGDCRAAQAPHRDLQHPADPDRPGGRVLVP